MATPTLKTLSVELETPEVTASPSIRTLSAELETRGYIATPILRTLALELETPPETPVTPSIRAFCADFTIEDEPAVFVVVTTVKFPQLEDMNDDIKDGLTGATGVGAADPFPVRSMTAGAGGAVVVNFALSPYTVSATDRLIFVDTSGGVITLNWPSVTTIDKFIKTVKIITGANTVTIDPSGAETIDGAATLVFSGANTFREIYAKGSGTNQGLYVIGS